LRKYFFLNFDGISNNLINIKKISEKPKKYEG